MFPNGGYSDMEAQLFNLFVLQIGVEEQKKQMKKGK